MAHRKVWVSSKKLSCRFRYQIREVTIQRSVEQLIRVIETAVVVKDRPGEHWLDDFITFNNPCWGAVIRQLLKGKAG